MIISSKKSSCQVLRLLENCKIDYVYLYHGGKKLIFCRVDLCDFVPDKRHLIIRESKSLWNSNGFICMHK